MRMADFSIKEETFTTDDITDDPDTDEKPPNWCEVCDIVCASEHAYDLHVKGKGHLRAVRLRKQFEGLTNSECMNVVEKEATIRSVLEGVDEPLIGLEYLVEFIQEEGEDSDESKDASSNDYIWICTLCDSPMQLESLVKEHFIGKRHRYKYLSKHYKEMSKVVHATDRNSDKSPLCLEYAQKVVNMEGQKFDSIRVAVNPNKALPGSQNSGSGAPPKKKPRSLMDINPGVPPMFKPFAGGRGRGPPMRPPIPAYPPGYNQGYYDDYGYDGYGPAYPPGPMFISDIIPMLEMAPITCLDDRDYLIIASQILEQKLVEYNTQLGLDPYDGVTPVAGTTPAAPTEPAAAPASQDETTKTEETTDNDVAVKEEKEEKEDKEDKEDKEENSEDTGEKKPVSLLDLAVPAPPRPVLRGWAGRGAFGFRGMGFGLGSYGRGSHF